MHDHHRLSPFQPTRMDPPVCGGSGRRCSRSRRGPWRGHIKRDRMLACSTSARRGTWQRRFKVPDPERLPRGVFGQPHYTHRPGKSLHSTQRIRERAGVAQCARLEVECLAPWRHGSRSETGREPEIGGSGRRLEHLQNMSRKCSVPRRSGALCGGFREVGNRFPREWHGVLDSRLGGMRSMQYPARGRAMEVTPGAGEDVRTLWVPGALPRA